MTSHKRNTLLAEVQKRVLAITERTQEIDLHTAELIQLFRKLEEEYISDK